MKKERKATVVKPGQRDRLDRLDQLEWLDCPDRWGCQALTETKAIQETKEHKVSAAKLDHRDQSEWLDHLDRPALREPPGYKGQQGHRGNRARLEWLDRPAPRAFPPISAASM